MSKKLKTIGQKIGHSFLMASILTLPLIAKADAPALQLFQGNPVMNNQYHLLHENKETDFDRIKKLKIETARKHTIMYNAVPNFMLKEITIDDSKSIPVADIHKLFEPLIGQVVSVEQLIAVNQQVGELYLKAGYLLSYAYIPKQDFVSGHIHIKIAEGSIRDVAIAGDGQDNPLIREYAAKIIASKPAKTYDVQRYLLLINKLPGYQAHFSLKDVAPGQITDLNEPADIILVIKKKKLSANVNIDNYGNKHVGRYQGSGMLELYTPFNMNERITMHIGTTNYGPKAMQSYTVGYKQPLSAEGTSLRLMTTYAVDDATTKQALKIISKNKHSMTNISVTHYPLLRMKESLKLELGVKYTIAKEYGLAAKIRDAKTTSLEVGAEYRLKDSFQGANTFIPRYHRGIGKLTSIKLPSADNKNYNVFKATYLRDQPLYGPISGILIVTGMYSKNNLPSEEMFGIGGKSIGRAYSNSIISTNRGINAAAELRYTYEVANNKLLRSAQMYGFYDIAGAPKKRTGASVASLASAGFGARIGLGYDIYAGFEAGFPLEKKFQVGIAEKKNKTKLSFLVNKGFSL
jgi:hemolysin activation/secretion protein